MKCLSENSLESLRSARGLSSMKKDSAKVLI
jgi:hypothetical protein